MNSNSVLLWTVHLIQYFEILPEQGLFRNIHKIKKNDITTQNMIPRNCQDKKDKASIGDYIGHFLWSLFT